MHINASFGLALEERHNNSACRILFYYWVPLISRGGLVLGRTTTERSELMDSLKICWRLLSRAVPFEVHNIFVFLWRPAHDRGGLVLGGTQGPKCFSRFKRSCPSSLSRKPCTAQADSAFPPAHPMACGAASP